MAQAQFRFSFSSYFSLSISFFYTRLFDCLDSIFSSMAKDVTVDTFCYIQVPDWNSKFDCSNRIVIMTCRLLNDAHRYMLRCLSTHEGVHRCTVFTSISEVQLYPCSQIFFSCNIYTGYFQRNHTLFGLYNVLYLTCYLQ